MQPVRHPVYYEHQKVHRCQAFLPLPPAALCFKLFQLFFRTAKLVPVFLNAQPSYLVLLLFFLAAGAGYYYIGRSGNNLVSVSGLELKLREILEGNLLARPRFKEIIIG